MRLAREHGSLLSSIYRGRSPMEVPWPLHTAVTHAAQIIGWFELPAEDQPEEHMWLNAEALNDHFRQVEERWKNGNTSGGKGSEDAQWDPDRGDVVENPVAAALIKQMKGK